jgi:outer membrane protein assembly factor BamB
MRAFLTTVAATLLLAGCGASASGPERTAGAAGRAAATGHASRGTSRDWTRFGYDAARTGDAPNGIAARRIGALSERRIALPGTVDASPIYLAGVRVGGARHDLLVMTTTYGITVGLDARTGRQLWRFTPASYGRVAGSAQITTATPVADPSRTYVYAASPDGRIHKLRVRTGREIRSAHWPATLTRDATHEKIASALNVTGRYVLATTGGYIGDAPPYQGKIVAIDRAGGRVRHVFNSLCSNRRRIIRPSSCSASDSAIWGRAGAVVDPVDHHVFATSSNGPFDGHVNWGDSIVELSAGAARFERHYTPPEQARFERTDTDLGSTSPALLPAPGGGRRTRFLLQGGKDAQLRLIPMPGGLHGVHGSAGRRLGGERQILPSPGRQLVFTAPAVQHGHGRTRAFVATGGGTAGYALRHGRLNVLWQNGTAGTSPVLAGGVLWVYDPRGALDAYVPGTGRLIRTLSAPSGHWNSPIVAGGRVYLPTGNANQHATSGSLSIYAG